MMCNSVELLIVQNISHKNKLKEQQEWAVEEKELPFTLFKKANQTYTRLKDNGSLLTKISKEDLEYLVGFLCHVKKTK